MRALRLLCTLACVLLALMLTCSPVIGVPISHNWKRKLAPVSLPAESSAVIKSRSAGDGSTEDPVDGAVSTKSSVDVAESTEAPAGDTGSTAGSAEAPAEEVGSTNAEPTEAPANDAGNTVAGSTDAPAGSTDAESPPDAGSTDAPADDVGPTEAPANDAGNTVAGSTDAPAGSTDAESPPDAESTEAPAGDTGSTEAPPADDAGSATEAPADRPVSTAAPDGVGSTEAPANAESTEAPHQRPTVQTLNPADGTCEDGAPNYVACDDHASPFFRTVCECDSVDCICRADLMTAFDPEGGFKKVGVVVFVFFPATVLLIFLLGCWCQCLYWMCPC